MSKATSLQPTSKAIAFLLTYIVPALVSAFMAASVGFGTSYVGVRDSLITIRKDIENLQGDAVSNKKAHDNFVNKEVQAETNRAVLVALGDLKERTGRIEQTQIQILQRLPAAPHVTSYASPVETIIPLRAWGEGALARAPRPTLTAFKSPALLPEPAILPGEAQSFMAGNRQQRRAVQALWRRAVRQRLFSKLTRRVAPEMCAVGNFNFS